MTLALAMTLASVSKLAFIGIGHLEEFVEVVCWMERKGGGFGFEGA